MPEDNHSSARRNDSLWSRVRAFKIVPQLDTYPTLVRAVETRWGKVAAVAAFAALLYLNRVPSWVEIAIIAGILSFLPQHRRPLLTAAMVYWLLRHCGLPEPDTWLRFELVRSIGHADGLSATPAIAALTAALLAIFGGLALFLWFVRRNPRNLAARRPVLMLLLFYFLLLAAAGTLPLHGVAHLAIWALVLALCPYLWFYAYAITDQASKSPDPFPLQIGTFYPFWNSLHTTPTPIGKGANYLRKVEARNAQDLAVVQLKAIKLLMWTLLLHPIQIGLPAVLHGETHLGFVAFIDAHILRLPNIAIPTLRDALNQTAAGVRLPVWTAWASVLSRFVESLLDLVATNVVVACCRMAGFNILRNTYKPLYAQTVAEFWNRYYYYFKELLVEFFFFPCYSSYFKKNRKIRLAAATIAAATVGNVLYHFGRDAQFVLTLGFWRAVAGFHAYAFYAVVLGVAIVISQMRGRRAPHEWWARRVLASMGVMIFYCLIGILAESQDRAHALSVYLAFFTNLIPVLR